MTSKKIVKETLARIEEDKVQKDLTLLEVKVHRQCADIEAIKNNQQTIITLLKELIKEK